MTGAEGGRRKARTGAIVRKESGTARVCVFRRGFAGGVARPPGCQKEKGRVTDERGDRRKGEKRGEEIAAIRGDVTTERPSLTLTKENRYA